MKPFNLEEAKAGKPVQTRDGRPARILAFDRKGPNPIIGLVTHIDFEVAYYWFEDGRASADFNLNYDLVMKAEKKEGWINLYNREFDCPRCGQKPKGYGDVNAGPHIFDTEKEARRSVYDPSDLYVATIKVEWEK